MKDKKVKEVIKSEVKKSCIATRLTFVVVLVVILILVVAGSGFYTMALKKGFERENIKIAKKIETKEKNFEECEEKRNTVEKELDKLKLSTEKKDSLELEKLERLVLDEMENATWEEYMTDDGISFKLPSYVPFKKNSSSINTPDYLHSTDYPVILTLDKFNNSFEKCLLKEDESVCKLTHCGLSPKEYSQEFKNVFENISSDIAYDKNEKETCLTSNSISCPKLLSIDKMACGNQRNFLSLKTFKDPTGNSILRIFTSNNLATDPDGYFYHAFKLIKEKKISFKMPLPYSSVNFQNWLTTKYRKIGNYDNFLKIFDENSSEPIIRKQIQDYNKIIESIEVK